jgi:hypothetical protein
MAAGRLIRSTTEASWGDELCTTQAGFDSSEGTGTLTQVTYKPNGSRRIDKFEGNRCTTYTVDSNGRVLGRQTAPLSSANAETLRQWKAYEG